MFYAFICKNLCFNNYRHRSAVPCVPAYKRVDNSTMRRDRTDVKDGRREPALCDCQAILLANCLEWQRRGMLIAANAISVSYGRTYAYVVRRTRSSGCIQTSPELIASIYIRASSSNRTSD